MRYIGRFLAPPRERRIFKAIGRQSFVLSGEHHRFRRWLGCDPASPLMGYVLYKIWKPVRLHNPRAGDSQALDVRRLRRSGPVP
jgi:hypothetical protein